MVASKERNSGYSIGETLLITNYIYIYIPPINLKLSSLTATQTKPMPPEEPSPGLTGKIHLLGFVGNKGITKPQKCVE